MRSTRIAGVVILVLLLVAGAALYYSKSRVSSLMEAALGLELAAERLLTRAVGAEVTIESIDVALEGGELTIRGVAVANPEGFRTPHALEADEIRVAMELASLLEDTVVVHEIAVEKPLVTYELAREGSNLEVIRHNVDSFAGSGDGPRGAALAREIRIENLFVRDGRIAASAVFLEGKSWQVPLADIHLRNISVGEGGIAAADFIEEATSEIVDSARESVAPIRELGEEVGGRIADRASEIIDDARRELEKGSGSARETLEQGSGSVRETLKRKAGSARESLERGTESARKTLGEGADSAREALDRGTESAREALGKGTDKVRKTLDRLLGTRAD